MSAGRPPVPDNSRACQRVLLALRAGPLTIEQISEQAHVGINTLTKGRYLRTMEAAGLIHVTRWAPPMTSGNWAPVWQIGTGRSAPKPPKQSNSEYARRWRQKRGNAQREQRRDTRRVLTTAARPASNTTAPVLSLAWLAGMRTT